MNLKTLKPITETKYLSVDNAWRYRSIMRLFYVFDQQFRHWLNKEDVYQELKKKEIFFEYTMDMCRQDLDALVEWGNLSAVQDTAKVTTYQQFVNKQFRYQMTEYSIEIERMTIRLENIFIEGGSLEPTLLERIKDELAKIKDIIHEDERTLGGWWSQLVNDFQRLNQNYQDYIRDWYSSKAEELMKTKNFLMYKEKLVDYLRHFIKELQHHSYEIESLLRNVGEEEKSLLFERVSKYELNIPRIDMEAVTAEVITENITGKYNNIERFFLGSASRESEVEMILSMTNEIIRRITRYAANILEMSSQYSNRKEEYKKIAKLFLSCDTLDDAHILSSHVFGISSYKHFAGELVRSTESIHSSIYEEAPLEMIIKPRTRTYREKIKKTAIVDRSLEKKKMLEKTLKEREEEENILLSYTDTGLVEFDKVKVLPDYVRRTFLKWLTKGMNVKGHMTVTEHGKKFRLLNPDEKRRCTVKCEDGDFEMPAYILEFKEKE